VKDPLASALPYRPPALVGALERRLVCAQSPHHGRGQIVFALHATGIAARHEKQGRRPVDDDTPDMLDASDARPLLEIEPQACEHGHLRTKFRRFVFTLASVRES
jgi:hypothetical protein